MFDNIKYRKGNAEFRPTLGNIEAEKAEPASDILLTPVQPVVWRQTAVECVTGSHGRQIQIGFRISLYSMDELIKRDVRQQTMP